MTTVDALKALYVVLGGSAEDVENITLIPDMINAYENLPSLTAVEIDSGERTVIDNSAGVLIQAGARNSVRVDDSGATINGSGATINSSDGVTISSSDGTSIALNSTSDIDLNTRSDGAMNSTTGEVNMTASNGDINLRTTGNGGEIDLVSDGSIQVRTTGGDVYIETTTANGEVDISSGANGIINLNSGSDIELTTGNNSNILVKIGSGQQMTLENYIKQVAGIS